MLSLAKLAMLAEIVFIVEGDLAPPVKKTLNNPNYLGSQPTMAYYFPWLVTIHRESDKALEFFGSGSILTDQWILCSMDSFVRKSMAPGDNRLYYQMMDELVVYSGGIWGNPHVRELEGLPGWFQKRKISVVKMFTHTNTEAAHVESFSKSTEPLRLNDLERSPFGFSMSICLAEMTVYYGGNREEWLWKRLTLPVPIPTSIDKLLKARVLQEIEKMEMTPSTTHCYVGGYRLEDSRLVQHKVVYIPLAQCQIIYCGFDQRACLKWPVNGTHVCFKSLTYDDMCWVDQGSALYCSSLDSVIAILTSGPTCGFDGLPGVYTLIHIGMELYDRVMPNDPYTPVPKNDLRKYTPPPQDELIPAYR